MWHLSADFRLSLYNLSIAWSISFCHVTKIELCSGYFRRFFAAQILGKMNFDDRIVYSILDCDRFCAWYIYHKYWAMTLFRLIKTMKIKKNRYCDPFHKGKVENDHFSAGRFTPSDYVKWKWTNKHTHTLTK